MKENSFPFRDFWCDLVARSLSDKDSIHEIITKLHK